jgi:hypothetical protein
MHDVIEMEEQARHPIFVDSTFGSLRIGYFIDWLDSRSDLEAAGPALFELAARSDVVGVACALTSRCGWTDVPQSFRQPHHHVDHGTAYGVDYHAEVVRRLDAAELAAGLFTYSRLHEMRPACLSAIANLAEVAARDGRIGDAENLLLKAAKHTWGEGERYGIRDRAWRSRLRSALSRFGLAPRESIETVLRWTLSHDPGSLAARLTLLRDGEALTKAAHAAVSGEQRELLRAAMTLSGLG